VIWHFFGEIRVFRGCPARAVLAQSTNVDYKMGEDFIRERAKIIIFFLDTLRQQQ
jgi:hypothetical protein